VNQGSLDQRLSIPETQEFGKLGRNFNHMLDTLQNAQTELQDFQKKELRRNYKLATIGEMAARLAHEIRNPVMGISSAIDVIAREEQDEENAAILEEVKRQADRVNHSVSDVLKYSRKKELDLDMNDINDTIRSIVLFLEGQMKGKEIDISVTLEDELPLFCFDNKQLEEVLLNLGLNAMQAIEKKGSIAFSSMYEKDSEKIVITVSDTGKGIDENDLSSIFHPFFTTKSEGTGLGLAIVKDVIEKHEGEIWAENREEGGCMFTIELPVKTG